MDVNFKTPTGGLRTNDEFAAKRPQAGRLFRNGGRISVRMNSGGYGNLCGRPDPDRATAGQVILRSVK